MKPCPFPTISVAADCAYCLLETVDYVCGQGCAKAKLHVNPPTTQQRSLIRFAPTSGTLLAFVLGASASRSHPDRIRSFRISRKSRPVPFWFVSCSHADQYRLPCHRTKLPLTASNPSCCGSSRGATGCDGFIDCVRPDNSSRTRQRHLRAFGGMDQRKISVARAPK